jgi:hypothetical protein
MRYYFGKDAIVWRRLEPADFRESYGLASSNAERSMWLVCGEGYEIIGDEIVATLEYSDLSDDWLAYSPLDDVPDLFLKFGKLYEQSDFEQAAITFSNDYGLPDGMEEFVEGGRSPKDKPPRMNVSEFRDKARRAWGVLAFYEAVLNGDAPAVKNLFLELREDKVFVLWDKIFHFDRIEDHDDALLQIGLLCAVQTVEEVVHDLCRSRIRFSKGTGKRPDLSTVHTVWNFDSLIGAMHLQMWWLMASAGDITRCDFCGRIVSLARSRPGGRKHRRDKRFCDDACRQAHHRSKKRSADSSS